MTAASKTLLILTAAAFAVFLGGPAFARQNGGGRGRTDLMADSSSSAAGAFLSIRLRNKSNGRWEFRAAMENAPPGLAPEMWIADAAGALVRAGDLAQDDDDNGEYELRLRSRKGAALPLGVATFADLAGRAFEVRDLGVAIFAGTLPSLDAKRGGSGSGRGASGGGADDGAAHDAGDDRGGGQGADDGAAHDAGDDRGRRHGGRGADDPAKRGADDGAGHRRRGRGADDAAGHR